MAYRCLLVRAFRGRGRQSVDTKFVNTYIMVKVKTKKKSEKLSHKIIYYALVTYAAILSAIFIIGFSMLLYTLATDPRSINSANFGYLEFLGNE